MVGGEAIDRTPVVVAVVGAHPYLDQLMVVQGLFQGLPDGCGDTGLADGYDDRQLLAAAP